MKPRRGGMRALQNCVRDQAGSREPAVLAPSEALKLWHLSKSRSEVGEGTSKT